MSDNPDCIIARCPDCKRIVFAAVNRPSVMDTEMFGNIGKLVSKGRTIEYMDVESVRQGDWGCKCK